jgi:hypothetical protein
MQRSLALAVLTGRGTSFENRAHNNAHYQEIRGSLAYEEIRNIFHA